MILILTECGGAPFGPGRDHTVFVNADHVQTWTAAAAPAGATCIQLSGGELGRNLFVRESPRDIYNLFQNEPLDDDDREPIQPGDYRYYATPRIGERDA